MVFGAPGGMGLSQVQEKQRDTEKKREIPMFPEPEERGSNLRTRKPWTCDSQSCAAAVGPHTGCRHECWGHVICTWAILALRNVLQAPFSCSLQSDSRNGSAQHGFSFLDLGRYSVHKFPEKQTKMTTTTRTQATQAFLAACLSSPSASRSHVSAP